MLLVVLLLPAGRAPAFPVFSDPVQQRPFEPDIITQPFGFQPFVLQDFLPLREKFLIETGLFHKLPGRRGLLSRMSHEAGRNESERAKAVNARNFS
jgi:hypothetical protein